MQNTPPRCSTQLSTAYLRFGGVGSVNVLGGDQGTVVGTVVFVCIDEDGVLCSAAGSMTLLFKPLIAAKDPPTIKHATRTLRRFAIFRLNIDNSNLQNRP